MKTSRISPDWNKDNKEYNCLRNHIHHNSNCNTYNEVGNQFQPHLKAIEINIFFRIYDDSMQEKGVGIVQISQAAAAAVLNAVNSYSNGSWAVLDKTDMLRQLSFLFCRQNYPLLMCELLASVRKSLSF